MASIRNGVGFVSAQDISQLVTSVNTALAALGSTNKAIWPKIAFVDDGSQTGNKPVGEVMSTFDNGDGTPGEIVRYGFSPVANSPKEWSFGKDRDEVAEVLAYIEVARKRYSVPDTLLYVDSQDVFGNLSNKIPSILDRAGLLYDWLLAGILNDNPTCFDGKAMFATDHPVDPTDPSKGVWSNDISISAADSDGLGQALDAFAGIPWWDGKARGTGSEKPILVVPTKSLELKFRQLIFGSMIPTPTGTVHVGASSPFDGMVEDVILFQGLRTERPVANTSKYCYLISKGTPVKAGLIVSPKRQPLFHVSGLSPDEEIRRKKGAISHGWDAYCGVGVGLPNDVVRVKVG